MSQIVMKCRKCGPLEKEEIRYYPTRHACAKCEYDRQRRYQELNRDKIRARAKIYNKTNPEKLREYRKKWKINNREKLLESTRRTHKRQQDMLRDTYVKYLLADRDAPEQLVQLKRVTVQLKRLIKEKKNA